MGKDKISKIAKRQKKIKKAGVKACQGCGKQSKNLKEGYCKECQ